jgi:hypothetical protein
VIDDLDPIWTELARLGRLSGHVVCRCSDPACGQLQMTSYRPPSQPWPCCVNHPGTLSSNRLTSFPRVVPVIDPATIVNKRPGQPRTDTQLLAAGLIRRPNHRSQPHETSSPAAGAAAAGSVQPDRPSDPSRRPADLANLAGTRHDTAGADIVDGPPPSETGTGRAANHDHTADALDD